MKFAVGDRVMINPVDQPHHRHGTWELFRSQSGGGEGVITDEVDPKDQPGWFWIKWDNGASYNYPDDMLVSGGFRMTQPEMELDEILLAQEMVNGV